MARTKASLRRQPAGRVLRRGKKLNPRQKREVKQLIGRKLETKYIDSNAAPSGITTAGGIVALTYPAAGTGVSQRVGDGIYVRKIWFAYEVVGYDTSNTVRVMLIRWNNDDSIYAPSVGSILQNTGVSYGPLGPYMWDNERAGDFTVVYDKTHALSNNSAGGATGNKCAVVRRMLFGKKLHGHKCQLNSGSTQGSHKYFFLVISDSAVINHPTFQYAVRMYYTDA